MTYEEFESMVNAINKNRSIVARDYWQAKKATNAKIARAIIKNRPDFFRSEKPSVKLYRKNALQNLKMAKAKLPWERDRDWSNPYSSESYSACGYEDSLVYRRDDANQDRAYHAKIYCYARKLFN